MFDIYCALKSFVVIGEGILRLAYKHHMNFSVLSNFAAKIKSYDFCKISVRVDVIVEISLHG